MIFIVLSTIPAFLLGILEKSLSLNIFGYPLYLGLILYLIFIILLKRKQSLTLIGYFYFLGLGLDVFPIGLLAFIMMGVELLYFSAIKYGYAGNKVVFTVLTALFYILSYLILIFILGGYKILFSFDLILIILMLIVFAIITSLSTQHTKYEG